MAKLPGLHVSIHAPARGATNDEYLGNMAKEVSIHAPARGATPAAALPVDLWQFQSTHPHGVRPMYLFNVPLLKVSIHAPARGATSPGIVDDDVGKFQSTHPHGVRQWIGIITQRRLCFNPRTRTGCDAGHTGNSDRLHCFNPRTRTGCDNGLVAGQCA